MTPLLIEMILHYHTTPGDYRDGDFSAPAVRAAIDWMRDEVQLIEHKPGKPGYVATDRLHAYVEKLCTIDLPVLKWVYPEDEARGRL